jgi:hypothetical protein
MRAFRFITLPVSALAAAPFFWDSAVLPAEPALRWVLVFLGAASGSVPNTEVDERGSPGADGLGLLEGAGAGLGYSIMNWE